MDFIELHIGTGGSDAHDTEAQAIGAVFGDQVEWIRRITERFAHFPALAVADNSGEVHVFEGHLPHVFITGHDHAGDPEEDDVRAGDQIGGRIECPECFIFGIALGIPGPPHGGKWPQPRTEPGVKHVRILRPAVSGRGLHAAINFLAAVPYRHPVSPPQLSADTPVLDAFQPVVINPSPAFRKELHFAPGHHRTGLLHTRVFQKPLFTQARLDGHIRPLAESNIVLIGLGLVQRPGRFQQFRRLLASHKPVEPSQIRPRLRRHFSIRRQHINDRQMMPLADLRIDFVMGRRDFQHPGAEFDIDPLIANDRNEPLLPRHIQRQRPHHLPANQMRIPGVLWIHRHCRVRRNRFRTRRRNGQKRARFIRQLHPKMIHESLLRLHDHFLVRQRRQRGRTPVDHPTPPINQTLLMQIHKHPLHTTRIIVVHGETRTVPVTRTSKRPQLLQNDPAILVFPLPDLGHQRVTPKIITMFDHPLLAQRLLHHILRRNPRMVSARKPHHLMTGHPRPPRQNVLDRVVQHMTHGQDPRHIRRRDDNRILGLRRFLVRTKTPGVEPPL